jgi:hypothetical protein
MTHCSLGLSTATTDDGRQDASPWQRTRFKSSRTPQPDNGNPTLTFVRLASSPREREPCAHVASPLRHKMPVLNATWAASTMLLSGESGRSPQSHFKFSETDTSPTQLRVVVPSLALTPSQTGRQTCKPSAPISNAAA